MRPTYLLSHADCVRPCIADLSDLPGCSHTYVNRINVPHELRGRGLGSQLLDQIVEDADQERVSLCLHPVASGGLSRDELIAWYRRRGFRLVGPPCGMVREPT